MFVPILMPMGGGKLPDSDWYLIGVPISFLVFLVLLLKTNIFFLPEFGDPGLFDYGIAVFLAILASLAWPLMLFIIFCVFIITLFT